MLYFYGKLNGMNLLKPKTIEDDIVYFLRSGERGTTDLLHDIQTLRGNATKQGFYAALRKLKAADIVVVYKKVAALNTTWIQDMRRNFDSMSRVYTGDSESSDILALADKESIAYSFSTIRQLDNFWGHTQNIIVRATPQSEPVYTYDPHYWFYVARPDVERGHIDEINRAGKAFLMTAGESAPLDKAIQSDFNTELRQYHMENIFPKNNYYFVVIGDFITEGYLDQKTVEAIESVYRTYPKFTPETTRALANIMLNKGRNKLKITRNGAKARKLKTKLSKNFFIKKQAND